MRQFQFEADIYKSLDCVPMAARRKLDGAGVKFSLEQWKSLSRRERIAICEMPAGSANESAALRGFVNEVVFSRHGTAPKVLAEEQRATARLQKISLFDGEGKVVSTVGEPALYSQPALSPDGKRVAAIRTDRDSGDSDVWVFDLATGNGTRITSDPEQNSSPVWSPDGKQLTYVSVSVTGNTNSIYRKASDGSGSAELIYQHTPGIAVVITDWSADGRLCFWAGDLTYQLPLTGEGKPTELFRGKYSVPRGPVFSRWPLSGL